MPMINEFWMRVIYRSRTPLTQFTASRGTWSEPRFRQGRKQNEMKRKLNPTSKQNVIGRLLP
jgi:hypothetical protein